MERPCLPTTPQFADRAAVSRVSVSGEEGKFVTIEKSVAVGDVPLCGWPEAHMAGTPLMAAVAVLQDTQIRCWTSL